MYKSKNFLLIISVLCMFLLTSCTAPVTDSKETLLRVYTQEKSIDSTICTYTYEIDLKGGTGGNLDVSQLTAVDKLQDWLSNNNNILILDMIPTVNTAGISEITFVFKTSLDTHNYSLNINEKNINLKNYVTSLCVRNTANNTDYFYYLILTDSSLEHSNSVNDLGISTTEIETETPENNITSVPNGKETDIIGNE